MQKLGVSPAYFISAFSDRFTPTDVAGALDDLAAIGYGRFQLEIFHPESLPDWEAGGTEAVIRRAKALGLQCSCFVAHFLLHAFSTAEGIRDEWGIDECRRVVRMLEKVQCCDTVVVPIPRIEPGPADYLELWPAFVSKIRSLTEIVAGSGRRLALEVMPGALITGSDGFLRLKAAVADDALGYNFDTGHAWVQGEPVWLIPGKLGPAVFGTHLCDNDSMVNQSFCPGDGTIPWPETMHALAEAGYAGPLDVEIKCARSLVGEEYRRALSYLSGLYASGEEVTA